ncbi:MAG: DNA polymerase I [Gammaproteobacteria bacterium]|jgi:DNA polymerase-1|nr:DNA polymerase I [Gammaproteobacteria bacterium]
MPKPESERPPLVLVDGSSYLYRAFHALPALSNGKGQPTGAVYGVTAMLKKLLTDYRPQRMAVVFDARGKTFRHDLYPAYKANRPPMPEELSQQVQPLHVLVEALGMPLLSIEGVEADDVIGTLTRAALAEGTPVVISTGDKDMAQVVQNGVTLVNTMNDTRLDRGGVQERFGVAPEQIVDYLALMGDKVDNIPGVPGVGPKTAARWLNSYGSLDALLERADEIKGKAGERLRQAAPELPLSRRLATIDDDLDLGTTPKDLTLREPDLERLKGLYKELEFRTWLKELDTEGDAERGAAGDPARYSLILSQEALGEWVSRLREHALMAFDTETTSLAYMEARVVGMSFSVTSGEAAYLPFGHEDPSEPGQLDEATVMDAMKPLLEHPDVPKLGHNLKYDASVLANHGITLRGIAHDTMLESYVLNSTASRHDLDTLCERHLGHTNIHYEDVAGKGAAQVGFDQVPLDKAGPYAAEDADMAFRLHEVFWPTLRGQEGQRRLYEEIEVPLIPVLSRVERNGVLVDSKLLEKQGEELAGRMAVIEKEAMAAAGETFNIGSTKQLQTILFEKMGLPVLRKTPKGQPSTAEDVLQELSVEYELPRLVLEHRSLSKLRSTYTTKLASMIEPRTGRVHTSYHQAVASTGRLSSADPNLQNIPTRTAEGRRIRQAFIAPPGHRILAADYSQIELRIMAHLSGDEGLQSAFREGLDVHSATAAEVFGVSLDEVTDERRRAAKAINFGLIYGMSAFGLARQLGIERAAAQEYVDLYFTRYPGVKAYMEQTRERAREQGYVETLFGRRLYLPEINARNSQRRQYAERTAINAPMQGTAADIIKRAMIAVDEWLDSSGASARMIMQVHDELVFEVESEQVTELTKGVVRLMSSAAELSVPLVVDVGEGENWDEAH